MSVTFYISEAPDHTVDCVYCEGAPGQDEHCLCKGTAKREVSTAPEFNMANSNAGQLLDVAGLYDGELCGQLFVRDKNAERIMMRLQATATLNRFNGSDYWVARCEQLIALIGWARENNHDDIQWA